MKHNSKFFWILNLSLILSACGQTTFTPVQQASQTKTEAPIPDVPDVPAPPVKGFKLSNGVCNADSSTSLLSCLKCDVPQVPQVSQLSKKAQALADVMLLACQIKNKSDKNDFRPTKQMILDKINRGSEALYPETARTAQLTLVLEGLTNSTDASFREKIFGGLWYKPPYTDAFETYFGLTIQEAKSTFCWDGNVATPQITGVSGLYSKHWADCQSGNDPFSCKELPEYVAALGYRSQLQNVLTKSLTNPYVAPAPTPQKVCSWDKFEGDDLVEAKKQFKKWKSEGRKLAIEIKKNNEVGFCGEAVESNLVDGVTVQIASYGCQ